MGPAYSRALKDGGSNSRIDGSSAELSVHKSGDTASLLNFGFLELYMLFNYWIVLLK